MKESHVAHLVAIPWQSHDSADQATTTSCSGSRQPSLIGGLEESRQAARCQKRTTALARISDRGRAISPAASRDSANWNGMDSPSLRQSPSRSDPVDDQPVVRTIGHGTRTADELAALLSAAGVTTLVSSWLAAPRSLARAPSRGGSGRDPKLLTAFPTECHGGANCEVAQVVEGPIPFFALCEHHALPSSETSTSGMWPTKGSSASAS